MTTRLSVIILSYLRTQYLDEAIDSVAAQEGSTRFELILVTAASEYKVPVRLLQKLADRGVPFIRIDIGRVPVGEGLAQAFQRSTGDVIAVLDDDDSWTQGKLTAIEHAFETLGDLVYFHNAQSFVDSEGRPLRSWSLHRLVRHRGTLVSAPCEKTADYRDLGALRALQKLEPDFNNSSIAVRRSVLEANLEQLREVTAGEDSFLFMCSLASRGQILCTSDRLTKYRIHGSTLTHPPGRTGRSSESVGGLKEYVRRHLQELDLAKIVVERESSSNVDRLLARDRAFWRLMAYSLVGPVSQIDRGTEIRVLMQSDGFAVRLRDGAICFLASLVALFPPIGPASLAAWRLTW